MATERVDRSTREVMVESGESKVPLSRLWLGLALAPLLWLLGELVGYYVSSRSCETGISGVPLAGVAHPSVVQVAIELVASAGALIGLLISTASWRAARGDDRPHQAAVAGRTRFMALTGVVASALFLFGTLLYAVSGFVVNACSKAR